MQPNVEYTVSQTSTWTILRRFTYETYNKSSSAFRSTYATVTYLTTVITVASDILILVRRRMKKNLCIGYSTFHNLTASAIFTINTTEKSEDIYSNVFHGA